MYKTIRHEWFLSTRTPTIRAPPHIVNNMEEINGNNKNINRISSDNHDHHEHNDDDHGHGQTIIVTGSKSTVGSSSLTALKDSQGVAIATTTIVTTTTNIDDSNQTRNHPMAMEAVQASGNANMVHRIHEHGIEIEATTTPPPTIITTVNMLNRTVVVVRPITSTLMSTTTTTTTTTAATMINSGSLNLRFPVISNNAGDVSSTGGGAGGGDGVGGVGGGGGGGPLPPAATIVTRIMQVPLLKAAAKKSISASMPSIIRTPLPVSKVNGTLHLAAITATSVTPMLQASTTHATTAAHTNWIRMHWPFIDPSSYFQWSGYMTEDSVLLPALLGFALITMILAVAVCLLVRNKRSIVSSVRRRNRNDIEETGTEDNATLLTATNLSDED